VIETVGNSFEAAIEAIRPAAVAVASKLRNFADAPEDVEVEFGLKFAGQAGAFIASASTEAQSASRWCGKGSRRQRRPNPPQRARFRHAWCHFLSRFRSAHQTD
jgi:hypothetical protein